MSSLKLTVGIFYSVLDADDGFDMRSSKKLGGKDEKVRIYFQKKGKITSRIANLKYRCQTWKVGMDQNPKPKPK